VKTPVRDDRRHLILRELGLLPLWVPRGRLHRAAQAAPEIVATEAPAVSPGAQSAPVHERTAQILGLDWPELKQMVKTCAACPLHKARKQSVFGVGDENADWLFVGEGPGAEEDARGEPFVGQAGRLLDNMLASIGLRRGEDVYIANIVKCRPPGNRTPESSEAGQCEPYLLRQIQLIGPKLIVALGKTAASNLLRTESSIGGLRGRLHQFQGAPLIVTYHPAYLLRNLVDKAKAWEDLCFAADTMARLKAGQPALI
jgi:uracil-DNA glycosylase family 4